MNTQACVRCRTSKRRCDKLDPICSRCRRAKLRCVYVYEEEGSSISSGTVGELVSPGESRVDRRSIKKRDRAILSCTRCHQLKVKCDRGQPCGRCRRSGYGTNCTFSHDAPGSSSVRTLSTPSEEDPELVVATWFLRKSGSSQYKAILDRLESLSGLDMSPFAHAMREHISGDCSSDFAIAGNFPFGSVLSRHFDDANTVLALMNANRSRLDDFVEQFLEVYHPSLPVLDPIKLRGQIGAYWSNTMSYSPSWLAQYLVVLGLGAYASTRDHELATKFFYASEACLSQSSYLFRPSTSDISTLCLMVLAKQAAQATCWAMDTCWNVMGVIVRLSMMTCLHQDWMPDFEEQAIIEERNVRRRLWAVVVFLDLQMSLVVGQQSLLPQDSLQTIADREHQMPTSLEDCWDSFLSQSFPVIWRILARVNARSNPMTYDEVLRFDTELQQHMQRLKYLPGSQQTLLGFEMFYLRALLVLHRRYALDKEAPSQYPESYRKTLDASLALSQHHVGYSEVSPHLDLVRRPYMLDFFAAAFTSCIFLSQGSENSPQLTRVLECASLSPDILLRALRSSMDLLAKEQNTSLCFWTGYNLLHAVFQLVLSRSR